jgi:K+-sensing histidine kinase KdpD
MTVWASIPRCLSMPREVRERGAGSNSRAGAGLGLTIVAAIAESHGGHAHAPNIAQGGADVGLELAATSAPCEAPPLSAARR